MINLRFFNGYNTSNKGYKLVAEYEHRKKDDKGKWLAVCTVPNNTLTDCTDHSAKKLDYYKEKDLSDYKCIDFKKIESQCRAKTKDSKYEITLRGNYSDKVLKYLRISVGNYAFNEEREYINIASDADLYPEKQTDLFIRYPTIALNNQLSKNDF